MKLRLEWFYFGNLNLFRNLHFKAKTRQIIINVVTTLIPSYSPSITTVVSMDGTNCVRSTLRRLFVRSENKSSKIVVILMSEPHDTVLRAGMFFWCI
jgi:tRNA uridine 5-carbamoylmethylation protein Kti12